MTGSLSQTRGRPEPGRELDVRIAIDVMGWTWQSIGFHWDHGGELYLVDDPSAPAVLNTTSGSWEWLGDDRTRRLLYDMPDFSTDIAAAWTVVEKMVASGYHVAVMCDSDGSIMCEMATPAWRGSGVESAPTAPHAVCLAALAALSPADDGGAR